jgi:isopropylmalate/homocitrate/citramalate synthase
VVGRNAFSHASPIHLLTLQGDRKSYEIMGPADVGAAAMREKSVGGLLSDPRFRTDTERVNAN